MAYSAENMVRLLRSRKLLSQQQADTVLLEETNQRRKLERARAKAGTNGRAADIIDVVSSLNLEIPGLPGEVLTEDIIMRTVAESLRLPFRKIDPLELDLEVVTQTIPRQFALKHFIVPIKISDGKLEVVVFEPQQSVLEDIQRVVGLQVVPCIGTRSDIEKLISEFFGFKNSIAAADTKLARPMVDIGNLEQYMKLRATSELDSTDAHIKNAVDYLFNYAMEQRASDIHIEPKRENCRIRLRIDGICHTIYNLPKSVHSAIVSRIKTLSRLDIAEKRRPQDGRIKMARQAAGVEAEAEIRVSTVPVAFGEKVVLRILDPDILFQDLSELGLYERDFAAFQSFIETPHGIVLVTGPTGSGKSTTLYSSLRYLASDQINITTIEDPIEMVHEQFNQIAVQPAVGVTFGNILRNILRQDPDVIMVGEIRDRETAESAIQAALTGHLVLSTLHTNDAASSITRLLDLGIKPFLVSSTLLGIVAQRLVRRVCTHCSEAYSVSATEILPLELPEGHKDKVQLFRGKGCVHCRGTGFLGRIGIFEVMPVGERIKELIARNPEEAAIRQQALKEGMTVLRQNAIVKMLQGITTFGEVIRVTTGD
ncbi:MAG: ATPase, T2SS/T4P/T4SS family [Pseudomonadota bacterium]